MSEDIKLDVDGAIATLTINRPERLNAVSSEMGERLYQKCREIDQNDSIKVVILTGSGAKAFSAGGDIEAWSSETAKDFAFRWDGFSRGP